MRATEGDQLRLEEHARALRDAATALENDGALFGVHYPHDQAAFAIARQAPQALYEQLLTRRNIHAPPHG